MKILNYTTKSSNFVIAQRNMNQIIAAAGLDEHKGKIISGFCSVYGNLTLNSTEDYMKMLQAFRSFIKAQFV